MRHEDFEHLQDRARAFLVAATGAAQGVTEKSPVYRAVTEGRDPGPVYSSCGDLAHWLWFRLGARLSFLNRAEHGGWGMGRNVTNLWSGPWRKPNPREVPEVGDVWVIWARDDGTDAHVIVCDALVQNILHSFEYGQAAVSRERWRPDSIEGTAKSTGLTLSGGVWTWPNGKKLQRVITLRDVIEEAEASGYLAECDDVDAWLARVGAGGASEFPELRRGDKAKAVRTLQELLGGLLADGDFGAKTEARLKDVQRQFALPTTGVCDAATWAALLAKRP